MGTQAAWKEAEVGFSVSPVWGGARGAPGAVTPHGSLASDTHTEEGATQAPTVAMVGVGPGFSLHLLHTPQVQALRTSCRTASLGCVVKFTPGRLWGGRSLGCPGLCPPSHSGLAVLHASVTWARGLKDLAS